MISAVLALCFLSGTVSVTFSNTRCPSISTAANFDQTRYLGRWFLQRRYYEVREFNIKCTIADYSANDDGTITMSNHGIEEISNNPIELTLMASTPDPADASKLKVKFTAVPESPMKDYWVLGTDYTGYTVVYRCKEVGTSADKFVWILTREQLPPLEIIEKGINVTRNHNLDPVFFYNVTQDPCGTQ